MFQPSTPRNLIRRVLTICQVKLTQSTALEQNPGKQKRILGDPGAVSRVDKMFVVKVYCKIETGPWALPLTEPVPEAFELPASDFSGQSASPGSLSNITTWRHNMVAISKVRNFRTRLSLSEILSDLIRCKLVRYPWFCSARPRSFTLSKWQMCITRIEVNFPLKVKRPSDFCSEIRYVFPLRC